MSDQSKKRKAEGGKGSAAKAPKTAEKPAVSEEEALAALQEAKDVSDKIDKSNEAMEREIHLIERKYAMQQESLFKNRDKILSKVPFFWMEVFQKQVNLRNLLDEVDLEILKSLTKFDVIRTTVDDDTDSFKMIFKFSPNPHFSNKEIEKTYTKSFSKDESKTGTMSVPKIEWKDSKFLDKNPDSFLAHIFSGKDDHFVELLDILREDVYKNAVELFLDDSESDGEGDMPLGDDDDEEEFDE